MISLDTFGGPNGPLRLTNDGYAPAPPGFGFVWLPVDASGPQPVEKIARLGTGTPNYVGTGPGPVRAARLGGSTSASTVYRRKEPEKTLLHRTIREHLPTFLRNLEEADVRLPNPPRVWGGLAAP
jgi:hypothetical protein